jgi:3-phenylpropionate/cinnamic acid dioxygenase small subunit
MDDLQLSLRIAALNSKYAKCLDSGKLELWPEFFTTNCIYKITTVSNYRKKYPIGIIFADSKAMLRDRVAALRDANIYERQSYRHVIGFPIAETAATGDPVAETPFAVVRIVRDTQTSLFVSGVYLDKIVRDGERLLLSQRVVVCDNDRFDTLLALPL